MPEAINMADEATTIEIWSCLWPLLEYNASVWYRSILFYYMKCDWRSDMMTLCEATVCLWYHFIQRSLFSHSFLILMTRPFHVRLILKPLMTGSTIQWWPGNNCSFYIFLVTVPVFVDSTVIPDLCPVCILYTWPLSFYCLILYVRMTVMHWLLQCLHSSVELWKGGYRCLPAFGLTEPCCWSTDAEHSILEAALHSCVSWLEVPVQSWKALGSGVLTPLPIPRGRLGWLPGSHVILVQWWAVTSLPSTCSWYLLLIHSSSAVMPRWCCQWCVVGTVHSMPLFWCLMLLWPYISLFALFCLDGYLMPLFYSFSPIVLSSAFAVHYLHSWSALSTFWPMYILWSAVMHSPLLTMGCLLCWSDVHLLHLEYDRVLGCWCCIPGRLYTASHCDAFCCSCVPLCLIHVVCCALMQSSLWKFCVLGYILVVRGRLSFTCVDRQWLWYRAIHFFCWYCVVTVESLVYRLLTWHFLPFLTERCLLLRGSAWALVMTQSRLVQPLILPEAVSAGWLIWLRLATCAVALAWLAIPCTSCGWEAVTGYLQTVCILTTAQQIWRAWCVAVHCLFLVTLRCLWKWWCHCDDSIHWWWWYIWWWKFICD